MTESIWNPVCGRTHNKKIYMCAIRTLEMNFHLSGGKKIIKNKYNVVQF